MSVKYSLLHLPALPSQVNDTYFSSSLNSISTSPLSFLIGSAFNKSLALSNGKVKLPVSITVPSVMSTSPMTSRYLSVDTTRTSGSRISTRTLFNVGSVLSLPLPTMPPFSSVCRISLLIVTNSITFTFPYLSRTILPWRTTLAHTSIVHHCTIDPQNLTRYSTVGKVHQYLHYIHHKLHSQV